MNNQHILHRRTQSLPACPSGGTEAGRGTKDERRIHPTNPQSAIRNPKLIRGQRANPPSLYHAFVDLPACATANRSTGVLVVSISITEISTQVVTY